MGYSVKLPILLCFNQCIPAKLSIVELETLNTAVTGIMGKIIITKNGSLFLWALQSRFKIVSAILFCTL